MADYSAQISDSLVFRKAGIADIEPISFILRMAVARMLAEGKQQWDENYPNEKHIRSDIESGVGFVLENSGNIIAYGAVVFTGEPAYTHLDGTWLSNGNTLSSTASPSVSTSEATASDAPSCSLSKTLPVQSVSEALKSTPTSTISPCSASSTASDSLIAAKSNTREAPDAPLKN